ncbi:hypothetical protein J2Y89_000196 [Curtobacterium herbarum]|uniref:hypothetical protein n=1 Tax=Curtobacterium herbarum TaxID=150122 RepID=UPI0020A07F94|nr:hypothetical protein [Curtobacterium herbarum]MCP1501452.1 hypothetical protein [Curtobacterium herbarum]
MSPVLPGTTTCGAAVSTSGGGAAVLTSGGGDAGREARITLADVAAVIRASRP